MGAGIEFGILGALEVSLEGGKPLALGGFRQRALLAILVLHANEVVSIERLVDQLWGERPPATAVHTVRVFVSRLRSALESAADRLVTSAPGYVVEVGVDEIDAGRCEHLYANAREALAAGNAADGALMLRDAVTMWRGPPLVDFTYEPFAQATIARLEELRLSCREELIEARLALGRHAEVVSDLEALVREQPFRERPCGQLMLALYRCGRHADALAAFQQARRTLVEELAVEPSAGLRDLENAILRQDKSLLAPSAPSVTTAPAQISGLSARAATGSPHESVASAPAADASSETMIRKTATVVVARLAVTPRADPEMARSLIGVARKEVERIVVHHGGAFAAGLGGEVVGVFGLPLTKEDDPLRALRAAEELRTSVGALGADEPDELVVRVGVDTGEVVGEASDDLYGEPLSTGIALSRAARDAEVLLTDATRRLASHAIRIESALDGTSWRLLGLIAAEPALQRRVGSPMVDRDDELRAACSAFARAAQSGETHLLTVVGDAGIGKSRLAQELAHHLGDDVTVLTGRCLSYGESVAFWPLREALTQAAGGESREAIRGLLADAQDADLVADIIAAALGLAQAETIGEQVPWAFRRLFEVLARRRPVMLVIDDAHWAEPALLDLVDYLIDWLAAPALLLCLGRPELLDVRPRWGGGHLRMSSLLLVRLSDDDASRLLDHELGERSLSAEVSAQILETAEGNPLFVEQLLAMNTEDPRLNREPEIPATMQSLLAARLDRLGPGERAFIQRAALIGREFWPAAVVELLPLGAQSSSAQHLRTLVSRGLIQPRRSTLAGEEALRFHHILIRDVAYRSTSKALRGELHERFADWLARRSEGFDEFVGYHLEQAFGYRSELGRRDADVLRLAARAGEFLATAGRRALSRGDANAGVKLMARSADLFEASGDVRPDVLLDLGSALNENGDFRDAERVLQAALEHARVTQAEAVSARALIELSYQRALVDPGVGVREMLAVAERAIAVFNRVGDQGGLSRAWLHIAEVHWTRSRCAEMEQVLERALRHAERAGERRQRSRILRDLARATVIGPRPVLDGIRRCNSILDGEDDDIPLTAVAQTMLAVLQAMVGRFDEARDRWRASKRRLEDVGLNTTVALLQMYLAFIELLAGTPDNAEPEVAQAYAVLERIGERRRLPTTAALLARLLYAQGRYDESERFSRITEKSASRDDVVSQVLWRGTRGKLLARAGQTRPAEDLVNSGAALAGETDFLMLHADALSDRADVLAILDRPEQAARDLEQAIALYERKGNIVSADGARRAYRSLAGDPVAPVVDAAQRPV